MIIGVSSIRDMISAGQEDLVKAYIDTFSCSVTKEDGTEVTLNPDIEHFLSANAIQFARMKTAITHLVFDEEDAALLGYFTLTHKSLDIPADGLTRKIKDKVKRFSALDENNNTYTVSAFLLAQFSKNYAVDGGTRISGSKLMEIVWDQLSEVQSKIGGTIVYLDCEAHAELIKFYEGEHFTLFGERISDADGKRYLQYLNFV
ncbi:MAG: GNAT family acetyltransferase [Clostridia bacterium]|nr:GNAT family acetyltransferase [Clostridia bacterium]